jgi:hypothetical protein
MDEARTDLFDYIESSIIQSVVIAILDGLSPEAFEHALNGDLCVSMKLREVHFLL